MFQLVTSNDDQPLLPRLVVLPDTPPYIDTRSVTSTVSGKSTTIDCAGGRPCANDTPFSAASASIALDSDELPKLWPSAPAGIVA